MDTLCEKFATAATRFGSGWAWVSVQGGKLLVSSNPNQDNPLMDGSGTPILGLDVWEHTYTLHYQNRRYDYTRPGGTSSTGPKSRSASRRRNSSNLSSIESITRTSVPRGACPFMPHLSWFTIAVDQSWGDHAMPCSSRATYQTTFRSGFCLRVTF